MWEKELRMMTGMREVREHMRSLRICISQRSSPSNVAYSLLPAGKHSSFQEFIVWSMLLGMSNSLVVNEHVKYQMWKCYLVNCSVEKVSWRPVNCVDFFFVCVSFYGVINDSNTVVWIQSQEFPNWPWEQQRKLHKAEQAGVGQLWTGHELTSLGQGLSLDKQTMLQE